MKSLRENMRIFRSPVFFSSLFLVLMGLSGCSSNTLREVENYPSSVSADGYFLSVSNLNPGPAAMPPPQVTFAIPVDGHVKVTLNNATGYEIKVIVDQFLQAGTYSYDVEFTNDDGKPLKTGIYFFELMAGDLNGLQFKYYLR